MKAIGPVYYEMFFHRLWAIASPGGTWAEVTIPKKGLPRPIRLGMKKGDGAIIPLELR
jgi:hypothetical protein